jgi:GNAT superfamily N-acetyltransferase
MSTTADRRWPLRRVVGQYARVLALRVRPAVVADHAEIGDAHAAAWEAAYTHIFDPSFLAAAAQGRRVGWQRSIARLVAPPNLLLVGEADGLVRAFAHAVPRGDTPDHAQILGFFAHPDVWGTGLAVLLMRQTCDALATSGFHEVALWAPREARQARHFYGKVDFALTGRTRNDRVTDWASASADCPEVEFARHLPGVTSA